MVGAYVRIHDSLAKFLRGNAAKQPRYAHVIRVEGDLVFVRVTDETVKGLRVYRSSDLTVLRPRG